MYLLQIAPAQSLSTSRPLVAHVLHLLCQISRIQCLLTLAPSDAFDDVALLDFEVAAVRRVRTRWGRCACAVAQQSSSLALLLGGNQRIGLFG
jgi:uncharacterized protein (DUF849 family)